MMNNVPKKFVVFAGLLAAPVGAGFAQQTATVNVRDNDPRLRGLEKFFAKCKSPLRALAADFLAAADRNHLDWRLLPSISLVESGAARAYRNNNVFGWNSGNERFSSIRAGIQIIASKLANSKLYRNKNTDAILSIYNSNPKYGDRVRAVMASIRATDEALAPTALN